MVNILLFLKLKVYSVLSAKPNSDFFNFSITFIKVPSLSLKSKSIAVTKGPPELYVITAVLNLLIAPSFKKDSALKSKALG